MWVAKAEYADGTTVSRLFDDNGTNDMDQQYEIETWLINRHADCTWCSVVWIND